MGCRVAGRSIQRRGDAARKSAEVVRLLELRGGGEIARKRDVWIERPVVSGKPRQRRPDQIAVGIVLLIAAAGVEIDVARGDLLRLVERCDLGRGELRVVDPRRRDGAVECPVAAELIVVVAAEVTVDIGYAHPVAAGPGIDVVDRRALHLLAVDVKHHRSFDGQRADDLDIVVAGVERTG